MKTPLKFLVQTIFLIMLTPFFLLGFLVGIVFHPVQTGFQAFKPFIEYIFSSRKEGEYDD
jgi:ATP/ADP translocase